MKALAVMTKVKVITIGHISEALMTVWRFLKNKRYSRCVDLCKKKNSEFLQVIGREVLLGVGIYRRGLARTGKE
jgi:hypothetical protein